MCSLPCPPCMQLPSAPAIADEVPSYALDKQRPGLEHVSTLARVQAAEMVASMYWQDAQTVFRQVGGRLG